MKEDINQVARTLAVEMTARTGELWRAMIRPNHNPQIESPTACLCVSYHWRTGRLDIHAGSPPEMLERKTGETITCNPERKPEAIAADICARLLTHAREHLRESAEYDRQRRQEEAEKILRLNFLRKYLPSEYQHEKLCNSNHRGPANIYASLTYDNEVKLEITLPLREALKVLKQITGI